jgi:hypothetical protein
MFGYSITRTVGNDMPFAAEEFAGPSSTYRLSVITIEGGRESPWAHCYGLVDIAEGDYIELLYYPSRPVFWGLRGRRSVRLLLVLAGNSWNEVLLVDAEHTSTSFSDDDHSALVGPGLIGVLRMLAQRFTGQSPLDALLAAGQVHFQLRHAGEGTEEGTESVEVRAHRMDNSIDLFIDSRLSDERRGWRSRFHGWQARMRLETATADDRGLLRPYPKPIPPPDVDVRQWKWDRSFTLPDSWDDARAQITQIIQNF